MRDLCQSDFLSLNVRCSMFDVRCSIAAFCGLDTMTPSPIQVLEILEATTGGTRRHLFDLAAGLDPRRFAVRVLCSTLRDPAFAGDVRALRARGIPVTIVPMRRAIHPLSDPAALAAIYRHLKRRRCAVVHTHSSKAGFLGRLAAHAARVRRVIHTPHLFPFEMDVGPLRRSFYAGLERMAARWTDRIVCVCPFERESALRRHVAPADKLTVIENGIRMPTSCSPDAAARLRRELGFAPDDTVVGAAGRLTAQKGYSDLVRAAAGIVKRRPGTKFVLAGDGELRRAIERLVARIGLQADFRLLGSRTDLDPFYALLDVVVFPSRWEALPYTLIEAMAAGRAIVAARVGGIPDVLTNGHNGLLVPPRDVPGLRDAVGSLLDHPQRRQALGKEARRTAEERFRLSDMLERIGALYEGGL